MRTLIGLWLLMRPGNAIMAAAGVFAGALAITFGRPEWVSVGLGAGAAFVGVAGANALNDSYDAEVDAKAHPGRPVPRALLTPTQARNVGGSLLALGVILAALCNVFAAALAVGLVCALVAYETTLKDHGWLGHATVSFAVASTFLLGALVAGWPPLAYPLPSMLPLASGAPSAAWRDRFLLVVGLGVVAFFANLGREILKAIEDLGSDVGHRSTYAVRVGPARAQLAARQALVIAMLNGFVLFLVLGLAGGEALLAAGVYVFVAAPFALAATRQEARAASRLAKLGMAIALLGFVALVLI